MSNGMPIVFTWSIKPIHGEKEFIKKLCMHKYYKCMYKCNYDAHVYVYVNIFVCEYKYTYTCLCASQCTCTSRERVMNNNK